MDDDALQSVIWTMAVISMAWLLFRAVIFTRTRKFDARLWGTIFESLSQYVQPLDQIKEPGQEITKLKKIPDADKET